MNSSSLRPLGLPAFLTLTLTVSGLSGCGLVKESTHEHDDVGSWDGGSTSYTTADVRTITRRPRAKTGEVPYVVCTEPTPDVAKALSSALAATAKVNSGKVGVDTGFSQNTAEALAELGGRSTALLALRDGLFRTCEAYANGSIGSAAYALVLSRYGELMSTLFLAEDVRSVVRSAQVTVSSPVASTPKPSTASTSATSGTEGGSGSQSASAAHVVNPDPAGISLGTYEKVAVTSGGTSNSGQSTSGATHGSGTGGGSTGGGGTVSGDTSKGTPAPSMTPTPTTSTDTTSSSVAAMVLGRMNEDFLALNTDIIPQLLVECINEYDPTVVVHNGQNDWLRSLCGKMEDPQAIATAEGAGVKLQQQSGRPGAALTPEAAVPSNSQQHVTASPGGASPGNGHSAVTPDSSSSGTSSSGTATHGGAGVSGTTANTPAASADGTT